MAKKFELLKVGTDAEVFLLNKETQEPVPACGLIGGTKKNPLPVLGGNGFAIQEDNVMLEFNVPPASTAKEFAENIGKMLDYAKEITSPKGLEPTTQSWMEFKQDQLNSEQAQLFGCEPDFCVWNRTINKIERKDPRLITGRSAAAHLHVSFLVDGKIPGLLDMERVVKMMDFVVSVPCIKTLESTSNPRRAFYGRAGSFRKTPYGIEHRVLGNEWIKDSSKIEFVFNQVKKAFQILNKEEENSSEVIPKKSQLESLIQIAINTRNSATLGSVISHYNYICGIFGLPPLRITC